jgi:hypothetical protein
MKSVSYPKQVGSFAYNLICPFLKNKIRVMHCTKLGLGCSYAPISPFVKKQKAFHTQD